MKLGSVQFVCLSLYTLNPVISYIQRDFFYLFNSSALINTKLIVSQLTAKSVVFSVNRYIVPNIYDLF